MKILLMLRTLFLAALSPLLEKNVVKTIGIDVPFVFSMGRIIILAFGVGMLRYLWLADTIGWPEATLSMAIVLALPVFSALDRVAPERVVGLASSLFSRFGIGNGAERGPSKFDDHRSDT